MKEGRGLFGTAKLPDRFVGRSIARRAASLGILGALLLLAAARGARAQESLDAILDRGHVAHWVVCGPFAPDVEGGILAALQRGRAPLGDRDFMRPSEEIARIRPRHLQVIASDRGNVVWQNAGTPESSLDLAPFFPEAREGVAYAAFYARTARARPVYFDLQTPLGARVWLNGVRARDVTAAPPASAGLDRFVLPFRPGVNLVILQVPGVRYDVLAEAAGVPVTELGSRVFKNRPLLRGTSGFEIALELHAAVPLDPMFVVPRLFNTGTFSGPANGVAQDAELRLFNTSRLHSLPVSVELRVPGRFEPVTADMPPIAPEREGRVRVGVPTGSTLPGQDVQVAVVLRTAPADGTPVQAEFSAPIRVLPRAPGGRVHIIAGNLAAPEAAEDQHASAARWNAAFRRQMTVAAAEPAYGFELGPAERWQAALVAHPEFSEALREGVARGRFGTRAQFAAIDERLATDEILARNIAMGLAAAHARLRAEAPAYLAWETPGIAAQTPQLLQRAGIPGVVSGVEAAGLPPFFQQIALDGSQVLHRRKQPVGGPANMEEFRQMVALQRREPLALGIEADVLVLRSAESPPDSFLLGATAELAAAYPSIRFEGSGAQRFFDDARQSAADVAARIPHSARSLVATELGSVALQPMVKRAHAAVETRLRAAETAATFASLLGAEYPGTALDAAWRQLLHGSTVEALAVPAANPGVVHALAGLRGAAELADEVARKALAYLAREVDTIALAATTAPGARALLVFNPGDTARTDVCVAELALDGFDGLTIVNDAQEAVPYAADRIARDDAGRLRGAVVRFVARDVPAMGYRGYLLVPQGSIPAPTAGTETAIENDLLSLRVSPQTGDIVELIDKRSGASLARGPLNAVLALREDPEKTRGGRELWTTGEQRKAAPVSAIQSEKLPGMERITIRQPFLGGMLARSLTLYAGVGRVDCETRLEGADLADFFLVTRFDFEGAGRSLFVGAPFGAGAASASRDVLDFRTDGRSNPSGTAARPALRWAALGPDGVLGLGRERALPLGPATVVHGAEGVLEAAARDVIGAFARRGIPAGAMRDTPHKADVLWTDSTEFTSMHGDLDHGASLRVVIGAPDQNGFTRRLVEQWPEALREELERKLIEGVSWVVDDGTAPEGYAAPPVLLFAVRYPHESAELARAFAESVRTSGSFTLPEGAYRHSSAAPARAEHGAALLFPGTMLAAAGADGTVVLGLGRIQEARDAPYAPPPDAPLTFSYAIAPYSGTWRSADVPGLAQSQGAPFAAAQTDLHAGRQPHTMSFLRTEPPGLRISSVKAAGYPGATPPSPRNGLLLRVWEGAGQAWQGTVGMFTPLASAAMAGPLEEPGERLRLRGAAVPLELGGFEIQGLWLLPQSRYAQGPPEPLGRTVDPYGPVFCRYWAHDAGAAPLGNLPISLILEGDLREEDTSITVTVLNQLPDREVEGVVFLSASDDLNIAPAQIYYRAAPGGHASEKAVVLRVGAEAESAGVVALTEFEGQRYRDVLDAASGPFLMTVTRNQSQVKVSLQNRTGIPAEGYVDLITPPEFWPEIGAPAVNAMPRRAAVFMAPFETQDVLFRFSTPEAAPWAVAKLAANGHVLHAAVLR